MTDKNKRNVKVGFTAGAFDLLHAGHILMLEEAKSVCDHLIVAVQSDPSLDRASKNKPIQSYEERIIQIKALIYVDEVILYDTEDDLINLLKNTNIDVRIIGDDHKGKQFTGWDLPIDLYFNSRDHGYSTSELRKRIYYEEKALLDSNAARS
jgi:glycerol-3-phosphate cytidylyltransferase